MDIIAADKKICLSGQELIEWFDERLTEWLADWIAEWCHKINGILICLTWHGRQESNVHDTKHHHEKKNGRSFLTMLYVNDISTLEM